MNNYIHYILHIKFYCYSYLNFHQGTYIKYQIGRFIFSTLIQVSPGNYPLPKPMLIMIANRSSYYNREKLTDYFNKRWRYVWWTSFFQHDYCIVKSHSGPIYFYLIHHNMPHLTSWLSWSPIISLPFMCTKMSWHKLLPCLVFIFILFHFQWYILYQFW